HKCTRSEHTLIRSLRVQKIVEHCNDCRYREYYKEPTSRRTALLQLTKSNAAILSVNKGKEAPYQGSVISEAQRPHCPRLRRLIHHVDAKCREQVARPPA